MQYSTKAGSRFRLTLSVRLTGKGAGSKGTIDKPSYTVQPIYLYLMVIDARKVSSAPGLCQSANRKSTHFYKIRYPTTLSQNSPKTYFLRTNLN
jgi:hypothetical protein